MKNNIFKANLMYLCDMFYKNPDTNESYNFKGFLMNNSNILQYLNSEKLAEYHYIYLSISFPTNEEKHQILRMISRTNQKFEMVIHHRNVKLISTGCNIGYMTRYGERPRHIKMIRRDWFNFRIEKFTNAEVVICNCERFNGEVSELV